MFTDNIESGEILIADDGQIFETENGVQYVKINFNKSNKNAWMKIET